MQKLKQIKKEFKKKIKLAKKNAEKEMLKIKIFEKLKYNKEFEAFKKKDEN